MMCQASKLFKGKHSILILQLYTLDIHVYIAVTHVCTSAFIFGDLYTLGILHKLVLRNIFTD